MRNKAVAEVKEVHVEQWQHKACFACRGTDGYYPTIPDHDGCLGQCGKQSPWTNQPADACQAPCPCPCSTPLTKNEIMELRDLAERLRCRR